MATATFVKDLTGFMGHASLYKMDPEHEGHEYVVASAISSSYAHETYLFPADENGEVTDWGELDGSLRGTTDHDAALKSAGYEVSR